MGFYKSYKSIPSMESIKIKLDEIKEPLFKQTLSTTYVQLLQKFDDDNLGFIKDTAINFCRFQQVKSAILQSVDLLKLEDYEQIYELINKTRYKGLNNDLGSEYVDTFDRRHSLEKEEEFIPFPWQVMTNITNGGMKPKKLYLVLAPTGVGKSWAFISIAAKAMQEGKKVVYYTLEMTEDEIGERIDSTLCGKTLEYIRDPDNHEKVKQQLEPYRNLLRIKEFLPNKTRLVEIENHYNLLKLFDNFDADVVIIDYGDIIKKESSVNSMYSAYGDVFTMMKTLAKEYDIPVVSGTQGQRCLSKNTIVDVKNKGKIKLEQVNVGDYIDTPDGYKKVLNLWKQKQPMYRIKLKDGKQIECSINHLFPMIYGKVLSLETGIQIGDKLFVKKTYKTINSKQFDRSKFSTNTLKHYQQKYGIKQGYKRWDRKNRIMRYKLSKQKYIDQYGTDNLQEYVKNRWSFGYDYLVKKHGKQQGQKIWIDRCKKSSQKMIQYHNLHQNLRKKQSQTLENYVNRYGAIIGYQKFKLYVEKSSKIPSKHSLMSQNLFWKIYNNLNQEQKKLCKFGQLNGQQGFVNFDSKWNKHFYYVDFKCGEVIIQFDGQYWHKDRKEDDKMKTMLLQQKGYKVLRISDNDYKNQSEKIQVFNRCMEFINENTQI